MPFRVLRHLWNQNDTDKTQELLCINKRVRAIFFYRFLVICFFVLEAVPFRKSFQKDSETISRVGA